MKKQFTATLMAATLIIGLAVPVMAMDTSSIRVSSYKGNTLEVGERSGLIIGPSSTKYTVTSSAPDTATVEQVLTFWAAVAKEEGSAEITVSNRAGEYSTITLTVGSSSTSTPIDSVSEESADLTANMEVRQELVRNVRPLPPPAILTASATTSQCSQAQSTQPNALSAIGSTLPATSRP